MTNEERDQMIQQTHDAVIVMVGKVDNHDEALYGNGRPGLKDDMTTLKLLQRECPARKAATAEGKNLTLAYLMMGVAILSTVSSVVIGVLSLKK